MILIVDYGMGNVGSIRNMLKKIGFRAKISSKASDIEKATRIILPGVGAFDCGIDEIDKRGLREPLSEAALTRKIPILGVCLGMQLLCKGSEEGNREGLGWIPGYCKKIDSQKGKLKIPHMGWNIIQSQEASIAHPFIQENKLQRFYFVHTYHMVCERASDVIAHATYGERLTAIINNGNIFGTQFHPEKSHRFGMQLFSNFMEIGSC